MSISDLLQECRLTISPFTNDLNLNVDLDELFGKRVDFNETGVDCAIEATKFGDQADVSLANRLVRVGAHDTTRDSSTETNARTEVIGFR